jgi:hypothetical protein
MTDPIRDIEVIFQEREAELTPEEGIPAVIKEMSGSVFVSGRTNYIWISLYNQPESREQALNLTGIQPVAENLCRVGRPDQAGIRQVLRIWDGASEYTTDADALGALTAYPHRQAHQYPSEADPGPDPVLIFQPALQPLKCTGDGATLTVTVMPLDSYRYRDTHKTFVGATVDLTSSVPSVASTVRYSLLYLNAITNAMVTLDGTAVPDVVGVTIPKPVLPEWGIACAYVKLANGQSTVTTSTDVVDAREFQGVLDSSGSGCAVDAHGCGADHHLT